MAATPKRAMLTEAALMGTLLDDEASWNTAISTLAQDFTPLSDMRASATYRMDIAKNLLRKALLEVSGEKVAALRVLTLGAA